VTDWCPNCGLVHHWHPDPAFYPGKTYSYICDTCRCKITVVIRK
jgi:hypothetical protein